MGGASQAKGTSAALDKASASAPSANTNPPTHPAEVNKAADRPVAPPAEPTAARLSNVKLDVFRKPPERPPEPEVKQAVFRKPPTRPPEPDLKPEASQSRTVSNASTAPSEGGLNQSSPSMAAPTAGTPPSKQADDITSGKVSPARKSEPRSPDSPPVPVAVNQQTEQADKKPQDNTGPVKGPESHTSEPTPDFQLSPPQMEKKNRNLAILEEIKGSIENDQTFDKQTYDQIKALIIENNPHWSQARHNLLSLLENSQTLGGRDSAYEMIPRVRERLQDNKSYRTQADVAGWQDSTSHWQPSDSTKLKYSTSLSRQAEKQWQEYLAKKSYEPGQRGYLEKLGDHKREFVEVMDKVKDVAQGISDLEHGHAMGKSRNQIAKTILARKQKLDNLAQLAFRHYETIALMPDVPGNDFDQQSKAKSEAWQTSDTQRRIDIALSFAGFIPMEAAAAATGISAIKYGVPLLRGGVNFANDYSKARTDHLTKQLLEQGFNPKSPLDIQKLVTERPDIWKQAVFEGFKEATINLASGKIADIAVGRLAHHIKSPLGELVAGKGIETAVGKVAGDVLERVAP